MVAFLAGYVLLVVIASVKSVEASLSGLASRSTLSSTLRASPQQWPVPRVPPGSSHASKLGFLSANKLIAFTLYGGRSIDIEGGALNARAMPLAYLGWRVRFYIDSTVPQSTIDRLTGAGAEISFVDPDMESWLDARRMYRFLAIDDPDVEFVMFRDADSLPSLREVSAVNAWLMSNKTFHVMRDHQFHTTHILAGMWGVHAPTLRQRLHPETIRASMQRYVENRISPDMKRDTDQDYLSDVIWPYAKGDVLEHDAFHCPGSQPYIDDPQPFPVPRDSTGDFVGNIKAPDYSDSSAYVRNGKWQFQGLETPPECRLDPKYIYG
ncbi:Hexosyltransferase [Plasmodiophora brassicae]|uniref:Hexosyltransferase n=1 Tax=Plasmodiophora brassicae TaxID=37360 RepID=A0A0G4IMS8_PLABS|nr:hypothetical protein PBRA_005130 [Plasmodiophora brassicae]SPQ94578.1 unnamed protein product [Plasmodiophora brassicae]